MAVLTKTQIAELSVDERLALIDVLWESIEDPEPLLTPPDWHRGILDQRIEEANQSPEKSIPWESVKAKLASKWLR